jgi:hypothetical protein
MRALPPRVPASARAPDAAARWGAVSIKGGRLVNEDWAQAFGGEGPVGAPAVYCVHDGHGGSAAVVRLSRFMSGIDWPIIRSSSRPLIMREQRAAHMRFMGGVFAMATASLEDEASGVVSIAALCLPTAVCFAWMGDCEGCVFDAQNGIRQAEGVWETDLAEQHLLGPSKDHTVMPSFYRVGGPRGATPGRLPIATAPHTLMGSAPMVAMDQTEEQRFPSSSSSSRGTTTLMGVEQCVHLTARGINFQSVAAQREYDLARIQSANPLLELDITLLRLGERDLLGDARFAGSVQPTRVMGDKGVTAAMGTLRRPTVLWAPLDAPPLLLLQPRFLLLCSDGAFTGGAFGGMGGLVDCLIQPLRFVQTQFYRSGQELSERLLLGGRLRLEEKEEEEEATTTTTALTQAWRAVHSWQEFLAFLDVHLAEIRHPHTLRTLQPLPGHGGTVAVASSSSNEAVEDDFYARWLSAATVSAQWLKQHTNNTKERGPFLLTSSHSSSSSSSSSGTSLSSLAEMAAHLAVLMGSSDNVTVLLAQI